MSKNVMFKLTGGEFIIGTLTGESDNDITVDTPMAVHFAPAPNGQLGINLFPLNPFASATNEEITIKRDHILFHIDEVNDQILAQYVEITSGITLAKKDKVEAPNLEIVMP